MHLKLLNSEDFVFELRRIQNAIDEYFQFS